MGRKRKTADEKGLGTAVRRLEEIAVRLERSRINELSELASNGRLVFKRAFLFGLARGLGMAIGFTVLGAAAIYLLRLIAESRLPYIAEFISKLIGIIENNGR